MSKAGKLIKDMLKAKKESVMGKLGDSPYEDPMEPWSAKYAQPVKEEAEQVDEGDRQTLAKKLTNKMYSIDKGLGKLAKDQNRTDISTNLSGAKSDMRKAVRKATDSDVKKLLNKEDVEQLDESDPLLFKYIRSLGYNPEQMDFASRSKYARSNAFKNYKISHMNDQLRTEEVEELDEADSYGQIKKKAKEAKKAGNLGQYHSHMSDYYHQHAQDARYDSRHAGGAGNYQKNVQQSKMHAGLAAEHGVNEAVEELDEAGTGLLMSFIKAKGLNPLSMDGNQKKSYSRSSEFRLFKNRHVKEISGMGERGDDWNEEKKSMKEEADVKDTVSMDIPLLIRVLEFIREDVKTDVELHKVVERLIDMRHDVPLTMEHYDSITGKLKESKDAGEYDYEGSMAKTLLQTICRNAEDIKNMLEDDENLPEWVQSKITKAEDYITTSLDYLKSTKELDEEVLDELSKGTLHSYMSAGHKKFPTASPAKQAKLDRGIKTAYKKMYPPVKSEPEKKVDMSSPGAYYKSAGSGRYVGDSVEVEGEPLQELKTSTLKSYVDKVSTGPSRGVTPKGTLKSIKAIGGVTKAIRKQAEKPLAELKKQDDNQELDSHLTREDLRKWFSKTDPEGDWKRINSKGEVAGPCAREPGEPKPKCMSKEKRAELSKSERAAAVATKRKHDPVADRAGKGGKPINVSNYGKGKLSEDNVDEAEQMDEKNSPTNPALWSRAKSMARSKFDVYPSAYANGWASKWYKSKGGGWKSVKEDVVQEGIGGIEDSPLSATNSVKAMESEQRKKNMKSARIIKSIYKKKGKNESTYDWEKDDKPSAKITLQGGTTMTGKPRDTVEIEPVLKTRPNSQKQ